MNWLVMICFVDLPNLTSITSVEYSFVNPRVVTLESISEYWILIVFRYSKSSKCQATLFIRVGSIEINFEYSLIDLIWFIDVSSILADLVKIKQWFQHWIYTLHSIPIHAMIIVYSMLTLFVPNPLPSFFGHWFRIQSSIDSFPSSQPRLV